MSARAATSTALLLALALSPPPLGAETITVASTTTTENSGLLDYLLPRVLEHTGVEVRVVLSGTGQALQNGRLGNVDALLVHHTASEEAFVAEGFGLARYDLMYNDFVLVGPGDDPARIAGTEDAARALASISQAGAGFVSRGDDSGTHKRELELWRAAGLAPGGGRWYRESGTGMGATLNIANELGAYCLTDRATWLNFANRANLAVLVEGDPRLRNQYGVVLVDPRRHPHTNADGARRFADWLLSPAGQAAIDDYRVGGQQAFHANAQRSGD